MGLKDKLKQLRKEYSTGNLDELLYSDAISCFDVVIKEADELQSQLKERDEDKARLDYLQSLSTNYGWGWILRKSTTGRGMRLHETSKHEGKVDVREAIDIHITSKTNEKI